MGFTPATIVAPNVPDKLDPSIFLTTPPRSKIQEQAQEQAQASAFASLRGMSPQEIEQMVLGNAPTRKTDMVESSKDEIAEIQQAKTTVIPKQVGERPNGMNPTVDYPYLFVNARSRSAYWYMTGSTSSTTEEVRASNIPVIELSTRDFANFNVSTIEKHQELIDKFGMAKFRAADNAAITMKVPFTQEYTGFKVQNQYFSKKSTELDYKRIKRGFFRALIRFHTSYGGTPASYPNASESSVSDESTNKKKRLVRFPTFERRAIDFFRMYHMVELRGGMAEVVRRKEWAQIGRELGYSSALLPTLSTTMRNVYMRVLHPFSQWSQLHADSDMKVLPQLDVVDDSSKFAELVQATTKQHFENKNKMDSEESYGWKRLSYGIVAYTKLQPVKMKDRKIQTVDTQKTPCFTLRSYRYYSDAVHRDEPMNYYKPKIPQLEQQYFNIPEFYQAEVLSPPIKLYGFPNYVFPTEAAKDLRGRGQISLGDLSDSASRNTGYIWPALITEDIDDLIVPNLIAGNKFSTMNWTKPNVGCYHVSIIIEGAGSTFYVRQHNENASVAAENSEATVFDQKFIDQFPGEIVVVSPKVEYMSWRHDFNTSVEYEMMSPNSWLVNACEQPTQAQKKVNIQSLVFSICTDDGDVSAPIKSQASHALKLLRSQEIQLMDRIMQLKINTRHVEAKKIIAASGTHCFFSFVKLNGEVHSCEDFLEMVLNEDSDSVKSNAEICTIYDSSVERFFDQLEESLNRRPSKQAKSYEIWKKDVENLLSDKASFPSESNILRLIKQVPSQLSPPDAMFSNYVVQKMKNIVELLHEWLSLKTESKRIELAKILVEATNGNEINSFIQEFQSQAQVKDEMWHQLTHVSNAQRPVVSLFASSSELLDKYGKACSKNDRDILSKIQNVCRWVLQVAYLIRPKSAQDIPSESKDVPVHDCESAQQFRDRGLKLGINFSSPITNALNSWISNLVEVNQKLSQFSESVEALDQRSIVLFYHDHLSLLPYIDPNLRDKSKRSRSHVSVIARMRNDDVMQRPLRSEVADLEDIPAIALSLGELDNWLVQAKQLPWSAIYAQIKAMLEGSQPPVIIPVSQMAVYNLYCRIFQLTVLPEDIAHVRVTFEKTLEHFKTQPAQLLSSYGFVN